MRIVRKDKLECCVKCEFFYNSIEGKKARRGFGYCKQRPALMVGEEFKCDSYKKRHICDFHQKYRNKDGSITNHPSEKCNICGAFDDRD